MASKRLSPPPPQAPIVIPAGGAKRRPVDKWYAAATGGAVRLPGFPSEWRDNPLNPMRADLKPDPAVLRTVNFLKEAGIRNLYIQTDKLVEFVNAVIAHTMSAGDQYGAVAQTAIDALDRLVLNYAMKVFHFHGLADMEDAEAEAEQGDAAAAGTVTPGPTKAQKWAAQMKKLTPNLIVEMSRHGILRRMSAVADLEAQMAARPEEERMRLERATKRQQEIMLSAAYKAAAEKRAAGSKPAATEAVSSSSSSAPRGGALPASFTLAPATVQPGVRIPVGGGPSTVDPADMHGPVFPPLQPAATAGGYRVLSPAEKAAAAATASGADKDKDRTKDEDIEMDAIVNQRTLLTHVVLDGHASEAAIKAIRLAFGPDEMLNADDEHRRRDIEDMERLERLLRKAESGTDMLGVPQHTGWLVFHPALATAISQAMTLIHNVCHKPFAIEVDLMTHRTVKDTFAELVAHYVNTKTVQKASALGAGGKDLKADRRRKFQALKMAFDKLMQVLTVDPVTGDSMTVLSFAGVHYDIPQRRALEHSREEYMSAHNLYYTDATQLRPYPAGGPFSGK
jgi:hypothetical protein